MNELKAYLTTRRSVKQADMEGRAPTADEFRDILNLASRTPDHGKLSPWRFITLDDARRSDFADVISEAAKSHYSNPSPDTLKKETSLYTDTPACVFLIFSPKDSSKIPLWEQQLACGAVGMNIIHASAAYGFASQWLTGWAAFHVEVKKALGLAANEQIAGIFFIAQSDKKPEDRPRPDIDAILSAW